MRRVTYLREATRAAILIDAVHATDKAQCLAMLVRRDGKTLDLRIEPVELDRLDEAVHRRGTLTAGVGAEEQIVLAT